MKRFVAILLAIVVLGSLFACSSNGSADDSTAAPAASDTPAGASPEAAGDGDIITITYARQAGNNLEAENKLIADFEAANPGIKVVTDEISAPEAYNKLALAHNAGNPPDVFMSFWSTDAASNGLAEPLFGTYIDEAEYRARFIPACQDMDIYQGELYGIPWRGGCNLWFANKDLLDAAGLEVPKYGEWDWDMFYDYAQKLRDVDNGVYGMGMVGANDNGTEAQFWPWLAQAGGRVLGDDGLAAFNSDAGVEAMEYILKLQADDLMPPGLTSSDLNILQDMQVAGKLCMWTDGPWMLATMKDNYPDLNIVPVPMTVGKTNGNLTGGTSLGMSKISKNKDAAWKFLEHMTSDESLTYWCSETGNTPTVLAALEDPYFQTEDWKTIIDLMLVESDYFVVQNGWPDSIALNDIVRKYIQAAYLGEMEPREALDQAAAEWNEILVKYQ